MDQPQIHMRRHNSLPAKSSSSSLLLRNVSNRFNPHVGTFRHAPPTASSTSSPLELKRTFSNSHGGIHGLLALTDKNCPYVGSFRHAPAYSNKSWLETAICELLSTDQRKVFCLSDFLMVSGHLRGGGPYWRRQDEEGEWARAGQSTRAGTAVSSVLVKLACWVLFGEPPTKSHFIRNKQERHARQDSFSDDSSVCTDHTNSDDYSCTSSAPSSPNRTRAIHESAPFSNLALVSSQAEAYYAHAMVNKETRLVADHASDDDVFQQNLDYTVSMTQMDVMRMMRNASRHLGVESIVQLPVITYRPEAVVQAEEDEEQGSSTGSFTSVDDSTSTREEMSWLLIQPEQGTTRPTSSSAPPSPAPSHADRDHICVICLEHFVAGDRLRVLPCHHSFHVGCIDRWLSGSSSFDECFTSGCPTCKKRPDMLDTDAAMNGSVPSWAFERIGNALAASQME